MNPVLQSNTKNNGKAAETALASARNFIVNGCSESHEFSYAASIDEPLAGFHIEPVQRVHTIVADFDGFTDLQWIHFCFYGRAAHDNGRVAMSPVHQLL